MRKMIKVEPLRWFLSLKLSGDFNVWNIWYYVDYEFNEVLMRFIYILIDK